jgi:putative flippase GtrA
MFVRYVLVSGFCLAVDFSLFLAFLSAGMAPAVAGAIGYLAGATSHYFLSVDLVFRSENRKFANMRAVELTLYLLTAAIGTGLTAVIIWIVLSLVSSTDAMIAKAIAAMVTFAAIYLIRSRLLMREARAI